MVRTEVGENISFILKFIILAYIFLRRIDTDIRTMRFMMEGNVTVNHIPQLFFIVILNVIMLLI